MADHIWLFKLKANANCGVWDTVFSSLFSGHLNYSPKIVLWFLVACMYVGGNGCIIGRTFLSFTIHLLFYIVCDVWDVVSLLCRLLTSCDCERKGCTLVGHCGLSESLIRYCLSLICYCLRLCRRMLYVVCGVSLLSFPFLSFSLVLADLAGGPTDWPTQPSLSVGVGVIAILWFSSCVYLTRSLGSCTSFHSIPFIMPYMSLYELLLACLVRWTNKRTDKRSNGWTVMPQVGGFSWKSAREELLRSLVSRLLSV